MKKITQEEFDTFKVRVINKCMEDIKEYGDKNNGFEFHPTIYIKAFSTTHKEVPLPGELFDNQKGKDICVNIIKEMLIISESPMICFATEGYQAKIDKDKWDINNLPQPSKMSEDQRDEVLFMCFESYNLSSYFISFIKSYNKETNKWSLKPHPRTKDMNSSDGTDKCGVEGRFANFYSN